MARLSPGESEQVLTPLDSEEFMAVAEGAQTSDGPRTVLVARALNRCLRDHRGGHQGAVDRIAVAVGCCRGHDLGDGRPSPRPGRLRYVARWTRSRLPQLHRRVPQPDADDEIGRLAATMNRMLERLESARNSQRRFVSDASHELRSPITTIRQYAEVALAHPDRMTAQELADVVAGRTTPDAGPWSRTCCCWRARTSTCRWRASRSTSTIWRSRKGIGSAATTSKRVDTSGGGRGTGARRCRRAAQGVPQPRRERGQARVEPGRHRSCRSRRRCGADRRR